MTDEGRALFAEVCERVDDDAVKLVYADWLEEHGDAERAGAVRLAVERRRLDDLDPRAWVVDQRLERLNDHPRRAWRAGLPHVPGVFFGWHGGLVTRADAYQPEMLRRHEEAIIAAGPITELELHDDPVGAAVAAGCRYAGRVRKILFHGVRGFEADSVARLAACPALAAPARAGAALRGRPGRRAPGAGPLRPLPRALRAENRRAILPGTRHA